MVENRAATEADLDAVVDILTTAFANDPVWGGWAFPDPDRERATEQRREFWRFLVRSGLRFPWVRMTPGGEAATLWIPPGESELTPDEAEQLGPYMREVIGDRCDLFMEAVEVFEANLPREALFYHLDLIGTHADHRGKGIGMALLREDLGLIDAEHMPAYLESTNSANLERYRSMGFVKIGEFTLPAGGPVVDTMWRDAKR